MGEKRIKKGEELKFTVIPSVRLQRRRCRDNSQYTKEKWHLIYIARNTAVWTFTPPPPPRTHRIYEANMLHYWHVVTMNVMEIGEWHYHKGTGNWEMRVRNKWIIMPFLFSGQGVRLLCTHLLHFQLQTQNCHQCEVKCSSVTVFDFFRYKTLHCGSDSPPYGTIYKFSRYQKKITWPPNTIHIFFITLST